MDCDMHCLISHIHSFCIVMFTGHHCPCEQNVTIKPFGIWPFSYRSLFIFKAWALKWLKQIPVQEIHDKTVSGWHFQKYFDGKLLSAKWEYAFLAPSQKLQYKLVFWHWHLLLYFQYDCPVYIHFGAVRGRKEIAESSVLDWSVTLLSVCSRSMGKNPKIDSNVRNTKLILSAKSMTALIYLNIKGLFHGYETVLM